MLAPSRILQHDLVGHHTGLAAAVDGFFQNLEELLEQEHLQAVQLARIDLAVQLQHQAIGFVLDRTQLLVECRHPVQIHMLQLIHHFHDHFRRLLQHRGAWRKVDVRKMRGGQCVAVGKFFNLLGNFVQGRAQRFDVFTLERGDIAIHQRLAELVGSRALTQARQLESIQCRLAVGLFHHCVQRFGAIQGCGSGIVQQCIELGTGAENSLQGEHGRPPDVRNVATIVRNYDG